jgi:hypothetical protein
MRGMGNADAFSSTSPQKLRYCVWSSRTKLPAREMEKPARPFLAVSDPSWVNPSPFMSRYVYEPALRAVTDSSTVSGLQRTLRADTKMRRPFLCDRTVVEPYQTLKQSTCHPKPFIKPLKNLPFFPCIHNETRPKFSSTLHTSS